MTLYCPHCESTRFSKITHKRQWYDSTVQELPYVVRCMKCRSEYIKHDLLTKKELFIQKVTGGGGGGGVVDGELNK